MTVWTNFNFWPFNLQCINMYYNHFSYLIKIKFDNGFLDTILEGCQTKMIFKVLPCLIYWPLKFNLQFSADYIFSGFWTFNILPHIGIDANSTRKVKLVTLNSVLQYYPLIIMVIEQQVNAHCSASYAVAFFFRFYQHSM